MKVDLKNYGLNEQIKIESSIYSGLFIARVTEQHRDLYKIVGENGEMNASVSGKLAYQAARQADFPSVGDWVMVDRSGSDFGNAIIHHILNRKSLLTRQAAGTANDQQVIAANVDILFICMSLNADFNLRRVERYLTIAWDSMTTPVIVLTKSDLCEALQCKLDEISSVSPGVDVVVCSSKDEYGFESINTYVKARASRS